MFIDQQSHDEPPEAQGTQQPPSRILTDEGQIIWQNNQERQAFNMLRECTFVHTPEIDYDLLNRSGMFTEFQNHILCFGVGQCLVS
jgi:hypothetical protein